MGLWLSLNVVQHGPNITAAVITRKRLRMRNFFSTTRGWHLRQTPVYRTCFLCIYSSSDDTYYSFDVGSMILQVSPAIHPTHHTNTTPSLGGMGRWLTCEFAFIKWMRDNTHKVPTNPHCIRARHPSPMTWGIDLDDFGKHHRPPIRGSLFM